MGTHARTSRFAERDLLRLGDDTDGSAEDGLLRARLAEASTDRRGRRSAAGSASRAEPPAHADLVETVRSTAVEAAVAGVEAEADGNGDDGSGASGPSGGALLVLDALKAKVRQQEAMLQHVPRCLICLGPYEQPLVSIQCWHVHCRACWLQSLGAKKLCPQCTILTSPADLRRVYF